VDVLRSVGADGVVTLSLDDGKVNAFDTAAFNAIDAALDTCGDASAVVLTGREGCFSAGLNIKAMGEMDEDGLHELLVSFGRVLLRTWLEPRPLVCAATGHAVAAGTMFAMACDHTVAAAGDFRWGLTETQIGFPLPMFAIALARGNVRTDRLDDLLLPGAVVNPEQAVEAGFADELAAPGDVVARATAKAAELAKLPRSTYAAAKRRIRGEAAEIALADLAHDIRSLLAIREPV